MNIKKRFIIAAVFIALLVCNGCDSVYFSAMKKAEAKIEPALAPLRNQVLFMKHNLNARAIAGLNAEVVKVQANVDQLVKEMEKAITQADSFIASLQVEQQ